MKIESKLLRTIIEGALMAYGQPLSVEKLQSLFVDNKNDDDGGGGGGGDDVVVVTKIEDVNDNPISGSKEKIQQTSDINNIPSKDNIPSTDNVPSREAILDALTSIQESCEERGFELKEVSSGWRFQVRADMARWVNRLWEEKPQRYSRALLETLSIIAYRQPLTRGDIEDIRGVAVSSHIIKTLTEREWIKVVGHRDVPGRPALFATTRQFLDYFNLKSLDELPSLRELADIDALHPELDLQGKPIEADASHENTEVGNTEVGNTEVENTELEVTALETEEVGGEMPESSIDISLETDTRGE